MDKTDKGPLKGVKITLLGSNVHKSFALRKHSFKQVI